MSSYQSMNKYVECICPKCGVKHMHRMFWTGTCTPRKYCKEHASLSHECDIATSCCSLDNNSRVGPYPADQGNGCP